jgi:hypothetical protein
MLKRLLDPLIIFILMVSFSQKISAQSWFWFDFTVNTNFQFGEFYPTGSGGKVIISDSGVRSKTGNIVLLPSNVSACKFTTTNNRLFRTVSVFNVSVPTTVILTRSGGGSLILNPNPINPNYWTLPSWGGYKTVTFGGTLTVGTITQNPPGTYSGSFYITCNFQ